MSRRNEPQKQSRFICCRCLKENKVGAGIQRGGHQRSKGHVKTLTCLCTGLTKRTQNVEVRYCDSYDEMLEEAVIIHNKRYKSIQIKQKSA